MHDRPAVDISLDGPLDPATARAVLDRAAELMASGDFAEAGRHYQRVVGHPDVAVTAAALLGLGEALYRLDEEEQAIATWESILELPATPATYHAWRNIAAARVREGDLQGAIAAYRRAERLAPPEDRAEIANRLGWLAKETGNDRAARRYFARGRGEIGILGLPVTWLIVGLTVVVSLGAFSDPDQTLFRLFALVKPAVAEGEYWRLWTVTLLHGDILHLFFNMYALWIAGPIVERMYGSGRFLGFYLLCAAAGSTASFVFGGDAPAVGASGAIFGLFGILLAASRTHHPVLDRRARGILGQVGSIILINLLFGLINPRIDNAAHVGGLAAGLWLGFLLVPGGVPTLARLWRFPGGGEGSGGEGPAGEEQAAGIIRVLGVVALVLVIALGLVVGTDARLT